MKKLKNYTLQPNAVFDLDLLPESMLIILYLNSRGKNWNVYKEEVRKHLHLGHTRHNKAWKQLIRKKILIKNKGFGKCDFVLNADVINALVTNDNVTNGDVTYVSVRGTNTDVATITDVGENMDVSTNTDLITNTDLVANTEVMGDDGIKRWIVNNNVPTSSIIHSQFPELAIDKIETLRNEAIDESFYNI